MFLSMNYIHTVRIWFGWSIFIPECFTDTLCTDYGRRWKNNFIIVFGAHFCHYMDE